MVSSGARNCEIVMSGLTTLKEIRFQPAKISIARMTVGSGGVAGGAAGGEARIKSWTLSPRRT